MTSVKDSLDKQRDKFWHKMTDLVLEYDLYTFDPNIKEMERDLMDAYDEAATQILTLFQQEVMAALPEKSDAPAEDSSYTSGEIVGWNQAISDMESRLKERLG